MLGVSSGMGFYLDFGFISVCSVLCVVCIICCAAPMCVCVIREGGREK